MLTTGRLSLADIVYSYINTCEANQNIDDADSDKEELHSIMLCKVIDQFCIRGKIIGWYQLMESNSQITLQSKVICSVSYKKPRHNILFCLTRR